MTTERKPGWYHVKTGAGWECAEWDGKQWYIAGSVYPYRDADFVKLGDRIPTPDEPWQAVPMSPTAAMRDALYGDKFVGTEAADEEGYWASMLSAAPKPGGEDG